MTCYCHFEESPGQETESKRHEPIRYTKEATCEYTYFNIRKKSDICVSYHMSGKLQSSYEPGYRSGSVLRVPNGRDSRLFLIGT